MEDKIKVGYNISKNVIEEFKILSKKCAINKSVLVENFIKDWIKKNKNETN